MRPPSFIPLLALGGIALVSLVVSHRIQAMGGSFLDTETGFDEPTLPLGDLFFPNDPYKDWTRPEGPVRVGIQVGHWFAEQAPDEQEELRKNTGAQAGSVTEWETNLRIAEETKKLLEAEGVVVDLLPTTIPPGYIADAFISIHADGSPDTSATGYKIAAPRRDRSGNAERLSSLIEESYGAVTDLILDPNVTQNMRGYYAFNTRRYQHAIHPMTPGVILETGFLTNPLDRRTIVQNPRTSAEGITKGLLLFLQETSPLGTSSTASTP